MADVPNVPGVPPLPSYAPGGQEDLMTADTVVGYGAGLTPAWGLYKDGAPAIVCESVVAFGFRQSWAIANYPIERGGFETYDRVTQPFSPRLQFASGTNSAARRALLSSLDAASADANMTKYDVVTPDLVYSSVSIEHVDYDRKAASGANLLLIEVWLQEVREQGAASGQNVQSPSGAAPQSNGTVQPSDVPLPTPNPLRQSAADFVVT